MTTRERLSKYLKDAFGWKKHLDDEARRDGKPVEPATPPVEKILFVEPPPEERSFGYRDGLLGVWRPSKYRSDPKPKEKDGDQS